MRLLSTLSFYPLRNSSSQHFNHKLTQLSSFNNYTGLKCLPIDQPYKFFITQTFCSSLPNSKTKNKTKKLLHLEIFSSSSENPSISSNSSLSKMTHSIRASVIPYLRLSRLHSPIGTWLLFWPCAWSISLASSPFTFGISAWYIGCCALGAFLMRSSGCIINDLWDRDIDTMVDRTKSRPIASGDITIKRALIFLSSQLALALMILLQFHSFSIKLGLSSMGLVIIYPLMKRFFSWPQLVLGMTFNWGALLGWTAVSGTFGSPISVPILLYLSGICWTLVYDTFYAHQDKIDDLKIGIQSTAINWGGYNRHFMFSFANIMSIGLLSAGMLNGMLWPYYFSIIQSGLIMNWQIYFTDLSNPQQCGNIFLSQFWIGLLIFTGICSSKYLEARSLN